VFPNGSYRVSQLVLRAGSVLQGVSSGTYPDNENISGSSVLVRIANTNKHLLLAPEGANYCRIQDMAIDGNKNNNSKGYGLCVADAAAGHESQIIVSRCYIHTNPESNIYLGRNRRANTVESCVLNYSATGDGITVAGSDNTIAGNIVGTPLDSGIANNASYCVYIAPGGTRVIGDIGCTDPTAAIARTNAPAGAVPGTTLSLVGAVVQGAGSDIFVLKNKAGKLVWKVTEGGSVVNSSIEGVSVPGVAGATEGARFVGSTKSGAPTPGTWTAGDFAIDQTGKTWIYNGAKWVAGGSAAAVD